MSETSKEFLERLERNFPFPQVFMGEYGALSTQNFTVNSIVRLYFDDLSDTVLTKWHGGGYHKMLHYEKQGLPFFECGGGRKR